MNTEALTPSGSPKAAPNTVASLEEKTPAELAPLALKMNRILVAIDFSPHAQLAFGQALALARQFGSEITVIHVLEQFFYPADWSYMPMPLGDFVSKREEESIQAIQKLLDDSKTKARIVVRAGRAWDEIVKTARELNIDLIVVGTHGYTGLRHVLLGSVAEKVVQHAPCAVLTVRPDDRDLR